jgi:uncharacterized phage-associated protein
MYNNYRERIERRNSMYNVLDIADYVIEKCVDDGHAISNLQLQKILYFIQKKFLQVKNEVAFPERIEAWQFGPVVPDAYYDYCGYGAMEICQFKGDHLFSENDKALMDSVISEKRVDNPWDLVEETHKSGGAWDQIFKNGRGNKEIIPTELIKDDD